ncbi:hypothetical protein DPMN_171207 [Dreissena polymorpha]|uniref:alkaline phosphatase n=1 Tax=Dreissena polymorpha TaxID=45954 RepID=A0A9D4DYS2_DREPO|nr:hypothetical protein DPMN_171207 [Dreissena polymorpha]
MGTINIFRTTAVLLAVVTCSSSVEDKAHWRKIALDDITRKLYHTPNTRVAKNVVLMIGDGMGISTVTSARILKGQLKGKAGEETFLNFEKFPYTGLSKVYSQDYQVPDSAATASAMMTGVKTNSRCMGVDGLAMPGECRNLTERRLNGMGHWANDAGKSTGFVTTSRVTHATPAAMYAVTTNRDWEDDRSVPKNTGSPYCTDIAWQLIHNNSHMNVIMGGGSANFVPTTASDPVTLRSGRRLDDTNLIEVWKNDKIQRNANYSKAYNAKQLEDIDPANTQYLLGLFASSHMAYELDRNKEPEGEPSLADMTRKAIQVLSNNDNGFFLMVEGARIDHGHHETKAKKALYDTLAFEEAVQVVMDTTREEETLIIVTADHSHVLTINGYPHRGNGILGKERWPIGGHIQHVFKLLLLKLLFQNKDSTFSFFIGKT